MSIISINSFITIFNNGLKSNEEPNWIYVGPIVSIGVISGLGWKTGLLPHHMTMGLLVRHTRRMEQEIPLTKIVFLTFKM